LALVLGALAATMALVILMAGPAKAVQQGGPVVLAGIDAEDFGPGGHGPISNYQQLVNDTLSKATNGGSGILVIGGGKVPFDNVTSFWDSIDAGTAESVTYVNGAANIASQDFSSYKMLAVVSDEGQTPFGGLTQAEHDALSARVTDVANFVNSGGGLVGFSSVFPNPYAYIGGLGSVSISNTEYSDITPTPEGAAVGITDALDVCCWHQVFDSYPNFLNVLAHEPISGKAAALGGANVIVEPACTFGEILPPVNDVSNATDAGMSSYKFGSRGVIPAKFQVTCDGDLIDTQAEADAHPMTLTLTKLGSSPDPDAIVENTVTGSANTGDLFRFSGAPDNFYIYNIAVKGLAMGTYQLTISEANGGGSHNEWFTIK